MSAYIPVSAISWGACWLSGSTLHGDLEKPLPLDATPRSSSPRKNQCSFLDIGAGTNPLGQRDLLSAACRGALRGSAVDDVLSILLVEDDQLLQSMVEDALIEAGFQPVLVASGEAAIALLTENKDHYLALVTDINLLGRCDGWELAKQAREIDPAFPIIYMIGASADRWASRSVPNSILLRKPFAATQLATAVSQLLNTASPPTAPS